MDIRPSDLLPALGGKHLSTPRYGWIPSGSGGRLFVWGVPPHTDSSGLKFCFDLDPKRLPMHTIQLTHLSLSKGLRIPYAPFLPFGLAAAVVAANMTHAFPVLCYPSYHHILVSLLVFGFVAVARQVFPRSWGDC